MTTPNYGFPTDFGVGGAYLPTGAGTSTDLKTLLLQLFGQFGRAADATALAALDEDNREDGRFVFQISDNTFWRYDADDTSSAGANVVVPDDAPTEGRWLRVTGGAGAATFVVGAPVADFTALKAIAATARSNGTQVLKLDDGSVWRFAAASTLTGDDLLVAAPAAGTGRWLRVDRVVDLELPVVYTAADATVLYTVPAGFVLRPTVPFWEVTTAFTTGATGAAGISSSNAAFNTDGDLLGGASLDAAASLTLGRIGGTVGAKVGDPATVLVGGDTILWDKASTFTAGAGFAHVPVEVLRAPAA